MENTETALKKDEILKKGKGRKKVLKNRSKRDPSQFSKMKDSNQEVLPTIFNNDVRPFLDAIDNLRNYGLDECLKLPTVIVIGDQSSGKSSILEAISGIQLPRGSGMVTRCPLQLQMKHNKHCKKWAAVLRFKDAENKPVTVNIDSPSDIEKLIIEAQNHLLNGQDGISDSLLTLSVEDPNVPDLTLIDLPGIARVSVGNQVHNLPEQIIKLLRKYASRKESIILTVCPCTTDLATTEALKLAKEYDPEYLRTYGVLTKADLIDKGSEGSVLKIIQNEVVPLQKGYTLVKCRGQQALQNKESLKETLEKEKDFFSTHETFRSLEKETWGIGSLSKKLASDLLNFIKRELPNIRSSISEKLNFAKEEELRLMCDYPTTTETKLTFVLNRTGEFLGLLNDLIEGKYYLDELEIIENKILTSSRKPDMRLIPHARKSFIRFHDNLLDITPEYSVDSTVKRLLETGQGKEPREFLSYDTFKKIALIFVKNVKPHLKTVMNDVYKNLRSVLNIMGDHYFGKYPVFKADFLIIVFEILEKYKDKCEDHLNMLLEKEKVFFTLDEIYEEKIDTLASLKSIKYTLRQDWLRYFEDKDKDKAQTMREVLPKYIVVYYLLAIRRISDNVAQTILYLLMTKLHGELKSKLPSHVAHQRIFDLLDADCVGVAEKRKNLKFKIEGLKKGMKEIDKLTFKNNIKRTDNDEDEDEDENDDL